MLALCDVRPMVLKEGREDTMSEGIDNIYSDPVLVTAIKYSIHNYGNMVLTDRKNPVISDNYHTYRLYSNYPIMDRKEKRIKTVIVMEWLGEIVVNHHIMAVVNATPREVVVARINAHLEKECE